MMESVKALARCALIAWLFVAAVMATLQFITGFSGHDLLSWVVINIH